MAVATIAEYTPIYIGKDNFTVVVGQTIHRYKHPGTSWNIILSFATLATPVPTPMLYIHSYTAAYSLHPIWSGWTSHEGCSHVKYWW